MNGETYLLKVIKKSERSFKKYFDIVNEPLSTVYIIERENLEEDIQEIRPELLDVNGKLSDEYFDAIRDKIFDYLQPALHECYQAELSKLKLSD